MTFINIPKSVKLRALTNAQLQSGMSTQTIEKDWWVTTVLRALQTRPYSSHLFLKGGTSLSKCWNLISRFSEDADISIDREFLGFSGPLSKTQISDKLRRESCRFVRETLQNDLRKALIDLNISEELFNVHVNITPVTTTDPETIIVDYKPITDVIPYIKPAVLIEVSGRSMIEPLETININSVIDSYVSADASFAEPPFSINAVVPQRTFIEKICLLHEEFAKPSGDIRIERMSRHLYDISMIMKTEIAEEAIGDRKLFQAVVEHRKTFIGLKGFDYSTLSPGTINIIPPESIIHLWEKDYQDTQLAMIYSRTAPTFDEIMDDIKSLNNRINQE